jgi:aromatic-L-amino-acid decarboxylase
LKLWFTIRDGGAQDAAGMVERHVRLTQQLAECVAADDRSEIVAPHPLNLLCIRLRSGDAATDALIEAANATRRVLFTRTVLDGRSALRFSIGGRLTQEHHVRDAWALLQSLA